MSKCKRPGRKTDNAALALKLKIRCWAIEAAGLTTLGVLDLCAGAGMIWRALREQYRVVSYCPCDIRPRMAGTIQGNVLSNKFLAGFDLTGFNVIDIDTYGEPWQPWFFLAPRIRQRTVVCLTQGHVGSPGGFPLSGYAQQQMDIPDDGHVPYRKALALFSSTYLLYSSSRYCKIHRMARICLPNVSYFALVVSPWEAAGPGSCTASALEPKREVPRG